MSRILLLTTLICFSTMAPVQASELEGDYLYKVTTVRAAPGQLSGLIDSFLALQEGDYLDEAGLAPPLLMRHSQGDQWDLMIIWPMQNWAAFHAQVATSKREAAAMEHAGLLSDLSVKIAFEEDHFALGPPVVTLQAEYADNDFYHIEMFEAVAGKADDLAEQRRMENDYLSRTGQKPNMIFLRAGGSDVDVFTIGFHRSLEAFATQGDSSDEEKERAARVAGFESRSSISFYLRSLISGHHDTLAVKLK